MFDQLTIQDIRKETADCVSIALTIPKALESKYNFQAGQYVTFRTWIDNEEIRRTYSICTSPLDKELRVAIKKVPFGKFSTFANESLKIGESIDVMSPMGKFGKKNEDTDAKNYVAFAAGSGITPILSLLKTTLQTEPNSTFCLVYGNKNRSSIIFKEEIEGLKNLYINRLSVFHVLSQEIADTEILNGRIDLDKCRFFIQKLVNTKAIDDFYICGPEQMINEVKQTLTEAEVSAQKIHFELFGTNIKRTAYMAQPIDDSQPSSQVTIRLDGSAINVKVPYQGESILDAALRNKADLPFACKGGVCSTCRCKVIEGAVSMDVNYALESDELEQGFVLACQSHPTTEKVIVDFDFK